jgi:cytosine deaminase
MDVIIRDATVRDESQSVDIGIKGEYVESVRPGIAAAAPIEIDASGGLVLPSFVDTHSHLDKAFFADLADSPTDGTLPELIELTGQIKRDLTVEDARERIERATRAAVANGTTKIRTHLDVGAVWEHTSVEAALDARADLADIADIQTVAMPLVLSGDRKGLTETDIDRLETALEMGVDAVGGSQTRRTRPNWNVRPSTSTFDWLRRTTPKSTSTRTASTRPRPGLPSTSRGRRSTRGWRVESRSATSVRSRTTTNGTVAT